LARRRLLTETLSKLTVGFWESSRALAGGAGARPIFSCPYRSDPNPRGDHRLSRNGRVSSPRESDDNATVYFIERALDEARSPDSALRLLLDAC